MHDEISGFSGAEETLTASVNEESVNSIVQFERNGTESKTNSPFLWKYLSIIETNHSKLDPWTTKSVNEESDKMIIKFERKELKE